MAVIQRHFLRERQPAWDDAALAAQLGLPAEDVTRAQRVLDRVCAYPLRARRNSPLGADWWTR